MYITACYHSILRLLIIFYLETLTSQTQRQINHLNILPPPSGRVLASSAGGPGFNPSQGPPPR